MTAAEQRLKGTRPILIDRRRNASGSILVTRIDMPLVSSEEDQKHLSADLHDEMVQTPENTT